MKSIVFVGLLVMSSVVARAEIVAFPPVDKELTTVKNTFVRPVLETTQNGSKSAQYFLCSPEKRLMYVTPENAFFELGYDEVRRLYKRINSSSEWTYLGNPDYAKAVTELRLLVKTELWNDENKALVLAFLAQVDAATPEPTVVIENSAPNLNLPTMALQYGEPEIIETEPTGSEWVQIQCQTDGCIYRNQLTMQVVKVLKTVGSTVKRPLQRVFNFPERDRPLFDVFNLEGERRLLMGPASRPIPQVISGVSNPGYANNSPMMLKPVAPNVGPKPATRTAVFPKHSEIASNADFERIKSNAAAAGVRILILSVGNLEGCLPCQNIKSAIDTSDLYKRRDVGVLDFNIIRNGSSDFAQYLHGQNIDKYRLPQHFNFPYVYLFTYQESDSRWYFREMIQGSAVGPSGVVDKLRTRINELVGSVAN